MTQLSEAAVRILDSFYDWALTLSSEDFKQLAPWLREIQASHTPEETSNATDRQPSP